MLTIFVCCSEHYAFSVLDISWNCFCISLCDDLLTISDAFMYGLELLYSLIFLDKEVFVVTAQNAGIKPPLIWQPKSLMHLGTKWVTFAKNFAPKSFVPKIPYLDLWPAFLSCVAQSADWTIIFFTSKKAANGMNIFMLFYFMGINRGPNLGLWVPFSILGCYLTEQELFQ